MLEFKPQKEIVYNRFLPYKDRLDEESNKFLAEIKFNLGRAVIFKETSPGILYWSNRLTNYLKIYGRKFSKEDHLSFIKIFFELTTAPLLDPQYVIAFGHVLILLLKKRDLISRDDLVLPWRPLYDLVDFTFYSKHEAAGLKKHPLKLEETVKHVVGVSRVYFSVESTQEMLDEWRPLMCPYDVTFVRAMFYFSLFLPTALLPKQHDQGFRLWFDEILGIWQSCTNSSRWEEDCLKLFARLAKDNIGYIDWNPFIPTVFTRVLKNFHLPVGDNPPACVPKDYLSIISSFVVWIICSMGRSSTTQLHLSKLFQALESFYHPSNNGRYSGKLQKFLYNLPKEMIRRLDRERFPKESWEVAIPDDAKLTDDKLTAFVECLKPAVMLAVFNKSGSFDAAGALQNLALIKPDIVLPTLLDKLYMALDTLTEPHQLTATLNCVTSVARALVRPDKLYPTGRSHVLPLLQLVLPGIDPNDFRKAMATFTFISTIVCLVPVVDCSEAVGVVEMTDDERELCLATARFEDFVLQFMDRCFVMIENSSFENTSELDSTTMKADQRNSLEGMMGMGVASTFHTILMQSSPKIVQSALEQLFAFCANKVLETKVAGKMAADMCRAASKTNAPATLKMFVPHCCSVIEHLTSVEGVEDEEEVDDQLLWNLQILSEVVRSSGLSLLVYKDKLIATIKATIHLKCKEAATLGATLLEHMLRPLSQIYPMEWKSLLQDFGTPPTEHLFIRDWGKPGDLFNLNIQWHIPSEEEKLFAKELLDIFLQAELTRLENFLNGSEILSREELQQSLNVLCGCLSGAAILLPGWDSPPLENLGLKTMVNRGRFPNTVSLEPDVFMGDHNSRARIAELIHRLLEHLLCHREDDTKALQVIVKIYDILMLHVGGQRDEFDIRWRSASAVKRAMEDKLAGKKKHVRALLIERVQLQHEMRILDRVSTRITSLHKTLLDDLFKLATAVYTEVRIKAQRVLSNCIDVFDYFARTLIQPTLLKLKKSPGVSHEEFKGALYILLNNRMLFLIVHYWEVMVDVWPVLVKADHSEKPSIITLTTSLADKMVKKYDTVAISRTVTDAAIEYARKLLQSRNPAPRSYLQPLASPKALPSDAEVKESEEAWEEKRSSNLKNYHTLVSTLVDMMSSESLRWRYLQICFNFLNLLVRYDVPLPVSGVKLCTSFLNHDALAIRKIAIDAIGAVLKQQKRPHVKVVIDPYSMASLPKPTSTVIQPGDREDNGWLHHTSSSLPKDKEQWEKFVFVDKTHWGYYSWPKKMLTYAPTDQQPPLGRTRDQLSEAEQPIYDAFNTEEFTSKFLSFLSLEDRKGKDKFSVHRFMLFKGLFRNFDDAFFDLLKPHLERLCVDSQESSQRCAVEIIAALVRGCKHWTYEKVQKLWDFLLPLLRKALLAVNVETLEDWGTCMATAVESRDPRRIHRFLEMLLEDPFDVQQSSFADSSRLYLVQGAFCQQEWRIPELLHRLLALAEAHLGHPYKNVRDRLGSVLCSVLMYDLDLPSSTQTRSPKRKQFVNKVLPQLAGLQELAREKERLTASNTTEAVLKDIEMAEVKDGSVESDERKESIKRLKTVTNWLLSHAVRTLHSVPEEFFSVLPVIILFDSHEDDPELQHYCHRTIAYISQMELPIKMIPLALQTVKQIASSNLWHPRKSILEYLQVMIFTNLFSITSDAQYVKDVKDLVLSLLADEQLEVREAAAVTFSGLVHYGFFQLDQELQEKFTKMANTKLKKKRRGIIGVNGFNNDATLTHRHAGVLGLASCVQAFPYDVPSWMPQVLLDLGEHLHDPNPIQATVKRVMSDFRRTHHDNWQEHKQKFTEDQLLVLTDLLVSPCYYA